jgi:hypothetical protein
MRRKPFERTQELVEHFARTTGDRPNIEHCLRGFERLGVGASDSVGFHGARPGGRSGTMPPAFQEKYGEFVIFVHEREEDLADFVNGLKPDDRGIYWSVQAPERGEDAGKPLASAMKIYGQDIQLNWWRTDALTETDERWERLDRVLTDFANS